MTDQRRSRRDVYIAIMVAAANGRGLHLSADECCDLSLDGAIATYAANGLDEAEFRQVFSGDQPSDFLWSRVDPRRPRRPWQGACRTDDGRWAGVGPSPESLGALQGKDPR